MNLINPDMPLSIKTICAKMFRTISQLFPKIMFDYLATHEETLIVLCTIVNTQDWDVIYNVLDGFSYILTFSKERGLEYDFIYSAFDDNDISPEYIESLIEDSEELDDDSYHDAIVRFQSIMMDEGDEPYNPEGAPAEGYEFGLDEIN